MLLSHSGVVSRSLGGPRAYVLDDDHQILKVVSGMLKACNLEPKEFLEPTSFFNEIKIAPPWVIVLDLALGQVDAVDIIRQLEKLKYRGKVLLMSGTDESTLLEISKVGTSRGLAMLPPLRKPFRINQLKQSLDTTPVATPMPHQEKIAAPSKIQLKQALINNWLEIWYQPKLDLKSLSICGAEALVRARHPTDGLVLPSDFLPPVSDPLYHPLSRFVLRRVMTDWMDHLSDLKTPLRLSVNIPISVLHADGFVEYVRDTLPRDARFIGLIIEATEDEVMHAPELAREAATRLKLYNVRISIDDFGVAYSSFARLRDLPFSELKLDSSFVSNCSSDDQKRAMCRSAIDLAHSFGASACAEGVETIPDLKTLIDMGCDTAQGFLFSKPQPVKAFAEMLRSSTMQAPANAVPSVGPLAARHEQPLPA